MQEKVSFGGQGYLTVPIFLKLGECQVPEIKDFFTNKLMYVGSSLLMPEVNDSINFYEGHGLFVFKKQRYFLHKSGFLSKFKIDIDIDRDRAKTVLCGFKRYIEEERELIKEILFVPYFKKNPFKKVLTVTDDPFKPMYIATLPEGF
jgi:hypothetical protein